MTTQIDIGKVKTKYDLSSLITYDDEKHIYALGETNRKIALEDIKFVNSFLVQQQEENKYHINITMDVSEVKFDSGNTGKRRKMPDFTYLFINATSKLIYPVILHFYISDTYFGAIHYDRTGLIGKAELFAYVRHYDLTLNVGYDRDDKEHFIRKMTIQAPPNRYRKRAVFGIGM